MTLVQVGDAWQVEGVDFGFNTFEVTRRTSRRVGGEDAAKLSAAVSRAGLWVIEGHPQTEKNASGWDGAYWLLEARSTPGYRVITRLDQDKPKNEAFRSLGLMAIEVADMSLSNAFQP